MIGIDYGMLKTVFYLQFRCELWVNAKSENNPANELYGMFTYYIKKKAITLLLGGMAGVPPHVNRIISCCNRHGERDQTIAIFTGVGQHRLEH